MSMAARGELVENAFGYFDERKIRNRRADEEGEEERRRRHEPKPLADREKRKTDRYGDIR